MGEYPSFSSLKAAISPLIPAPIIAISVVFFSIRIKIGKVVGLFLEIYSAEFIVTSDTEKLPEPSLDTIFMV